MPLFHYTFFHPFQYTHMKPLFRKFFRPNSNDRSQMPAHDDSCYDSFRASCSCEIWKLTFFDSAFLKFYPFVFDSCVRLQTIPFKLNIPLKTFSLTLIHLLFIFTSLPSIFSTLISFGKFLILYGNVKIKSYCRKQKQPQITFQLGCANFDLSIANRQPQPPVYLRLANLP